MCAGEKSHALAPRSYKRGKRTKRNYIIAFSLVGAALLAGLAFWLVRRYRKNTVAKGHPAHVQGPLVGQKGGSPNVWFGSSGLSGR